MNIKVLKVIEGEKVFKKKIWMMRKDGRYIKEYREKRKKEGRFIDLCYQKDMEVEVKLKKIRSLGFDEEIMF